MGYDPKRQVCVYIVAEEGSPDICKIGVTELLARRLGSMQSNNWRKLTIAAAFPVPTIDLAQEIEGDILHTFRRNILRGEWIGISPNRLEDAIECHLKSIGLATLNVIKEETVIIKLWSNQ